MKNSRLEEKIRLCQLTGIPRIEAIAFYTRGERQEAAKRCVEKRARRLFLMSAGISFEDACTIVNIENKTLTVL